MNLDIDQTLRSRLKNETMTRHAQAEERWAFLMRNDLTEHDYIQVLLSMAQFHQSFEAFLQRVQNRCPAAEFYLRDRCKAEKIIQDLESYRARNRISKDVIEFTEDDQLDCRLWGMFYVIEGSTLGAQLIKKNLQRVLGVNEQSGGRFFSAYGVETGKMWQSFLKAMDNADTQRNPDLVISAACETFEKLSL